VSHRRSRSTRAATWSRGFTKYDRLSRTTPHRTAKPVLVAALSRGGEIRWSVGVQCCGDGPSRHHKDCRDHADRSSRPRDTFQFEPEPFAWPDTGVNIHVLDPGQPASPYHSEPVQEDFLVLHGQCRLIADEEEHALRQWDLVHLPAGVAHVFVGAGDGPYGVVFPPRVARESFDKHVPIGAAQSSMDR
jgi:mannose-6-phosphate isomerase-like protein (cupin superfamily)